MKYLLVQIYENGPGYITTVDTADIQLPLALNVTRHSEVDKG